MSTGADTKANTRGGCSLEVGDHRLVEDGNERSCALDSDLIVAETARDSGGSQRSGACQRVLTQKGTLLWAVAHLSEVTALPLSALHSLVMPSTV